MAESDVPSLEASLKGHKCDVFAVDFLPNGKQLVSASSDGSLIFWNLEKSNKHSCCYRLLAHRDVIFGVSCASNGSFVLSCSRDKSVRLWKVENDRLCQDSIVYKSAATVRHVDASPNCEYFCSASDDKTVKLWSSLHTNKYVCSFSGHNNWVRSCKFSKFSESLIASCGDDSSICLFDIREKRRVEKISSKTLSHFIDLAWYPGSDTLLSVASQDSSVRIYDIRMNKLLQYYGAHTNTVNSVSIHPLGGYLLSSSSDETSKIFDLLEGRILFTLRLHKGSVFACKFSPDGDCFATAGSDKVVNVWKSNLFARSKTRTNHSEQSTFTKSVRASSLSGVVFNENGNEIIEMSDTEEDEDSGSTNSQLKLIIDQLSTLVKSVSLLEKRVTKLEEYIPRQS